MSGKRSMIRLWARIAVYTILIVVSLAIAFPYFWMVVTTLKPPSEVVDGRVAAAIDSELRKLDKDYADLEGILGLRPVEVTILPEGAFQGYMTRQREAGADPAHLKPPHMNPPQSVLEQLMASTGSRELAPSR